MSDELRAYWATDPVGSRPLLKSPEPTLLEDVEYYFFEYLAEPLLAAVISGILGVILTAAAMLMGWI